MSGLIAAIGGGLAGYAAGVREDEAKAAAIEEKKAARKHDFDLLAERTRIDDERETRREERTIAKEERGVSAKRAEEEYQRTRYGEDMRAIISESDTNIASNQMQGLSGGVGVGARVSVDDLENLRRNPAAVEAYRKAGAKGLIEANPEADAQERARVAIENGRPDMAKDFSSESARLLADRKQDSLEKRQAEQHADSMKRLDLQISQSNKALTHSLKSETNAQIRAQVSASQSAASTYRDLADKALMKLANPDIDSNPTLKEQLTKQLSSNLALATQEAAVLSNYAKTGKWEEVNQPEKTGGGIDDLFPVKGKAGSVVSTSKPPIDIPIKPQMTLKQVQKELSEIDNSPMGKYPSEPARLARKEELIKLQSSLMGNR